MTELSALPDLTDVALPPTQWVCSGRAQGCGDVFQTRGGAAYLALISETPVVPVAYLGTRPAGAPTSSMPGRGARLDTVFGAPLKFEQPWAPTKARVRAVQAEIQAALAAHVQAACG